MKVKNLTLWRRALSSVALAAALTAAAATTASAKELRLAHFVPPQHVMHQQLMTPWTREVAERSGGDLTVRIYPAGQLGGKPPGHYVMAVQGLADITFGLQGYTADRFPLTTVTELPGVADDAIEATKELWAIWDKHIAKEYADVKPIAIWANDQQVLISKKPIRSPEDLKGMKVRAASRLTSEMVRSLGGVPVSMPVTEAYLALERGVVDAVMIPASAVKQFKLHEVADYVTVGIPLGYSPMFLVMNKGTYERLPAEQKKVIDETTGQALSVKAATHYDEARQEGIELVRKSPGIELIELSPEQAKEWLAPRNVEAVVKHWKTGVARTGSDAEAILSAFGIGG
jgi:TRAP-type C4-dicarboxylate transport system substrate-binding protein